MVDQPVKLSSTEFEHKFFAGAETVTVEIELLKETCEDLLAAVEGYGWQQEEGLRTLLTLGLGAAQAQGLEQGGAGERERLGQRLIKLESVAAVMKFRTYEFMKDNQAMEMRMGALRNAVTGHKAVIARLKEENAALEQELAGCQATEGTSPAGAEPGTGSPVRSWRRWVRCLRQPVRCLRQPVRCLRGGD